MNCLKDMNVSFKKADDVILCVYFNCNNLFKYTVI